MTTDSQTTPTGTIDNCPDCDAYTPRGSLPHLCAKGHKTETNNIPEGWVLVPKAVTGEMMNAARDFFTQYGPGVRFDEIYQRMIDAAPSPPEVPRDWRENV